MAVVEYRDIILQASGVSLTLGQRTVLREVELEVRDLHREAQTTGQVVSLLGPSGMGKTQLLRILAGLQAPSSGSVRVGRELAPVEVGRVGVVAQTCPLFEHRSVEGNLVLAGRGRGLGRAQARDEARALLARLGLSQQARAWPAQLSGGQRQRAAIAQQVMGRRHFLLMDEPFSGQDPLAVEALCGLIAEIATLDTLNTVVLVTHDIEAAVRVSDTVWLLGRDRDARGASLPGARIQHRYDLVSLGLAWQPDVRALPGYGELVRELHRRFAEL